MKRQRSIEKYADESNKKLQIERSQTVNCLESLSNELLYEIFDYLEGCALFEAFGNLNSRFQSLIQSPCLSLKIDAHWKVEDHENQQLANIILSNRSHIISLKLYTYSSSLIKCSFLPLDASFHHLQSLDIESIKYDDDSIIPVLTNLTFLPQLTSISLDFDDEPKEISSIYQIIFNMPVLKYIKLSFFPESPWDTPLYLPLSLTNVGGFSQIKYLNICHSIIFNELISILSYISELHELICFWLIDSDEPVTTNFLNPIKTLARITFFQCDVEFAKLTLFFSKISPNVEVIRLCNDDSVDLFSYFDPDEWEKFITNNLALLRRFEFTYRQRIDTGLDEVPITENINRFNSSFWTRHNWIFQVFIDLNPNSFDEMCVTYSVAPPRQSQIVEWNNSAANQLTIDDIWDTDSDITYLILIDSILTAIDIFTLRITCDKIFIGTLIHLLLSLPEVTSLIVSSLELMHPRTLSIDDEESLEIISEYNKITHVKLKRVFDLPEIHFLLQLCSSIEYFEMSLETKDLVIKVVRYILMKNVKYIPNLLTLCLRTNEPTSVMEELKRIIDLEQLCQNYTMEQRDDKIYLKFTR